MLLCLQFPEESLACLGVGRNAYLGEPRGRRDEPRGRRDEPQEDQEQNEGLGLLTQGLNIEWFGGLEGRLSTLMKARGGDTAVHTAELLLTARPGAGGVEGMHGSG